MIVCFECKRMIIRKLVHTLHINVSNAICCVLGWPVYPSTQQIALETKHVPVWSTFLMIVCFECKQTSCIRKLVQYCTKMFLMLSVCALGWPVYPSTQQIALVTKHMPVWSNFLMIVCFECKRAIIRKLLQYWHINVSNAMCCVLGWPVYPSTQQIALETKHMPVWSNFLMSVCLQCKRAIIRKLVHTLHINTPNAICCVLGWPVYPSTQQMHWKHLCACVTVTF